MNIYGLYFSPTGHSASYVLSLAQILSPDFKELDLTNQEERHTRHAFSQDDIVCVGVPVYGGRTPKPYDGLLDSLEGNGARIICMVTYGNRDYEDALLELCDSCRDRGFRVIAAGAFIAQHSYTAQMGTNRPDELDKEKLQQFAELVQNKIKENDTEEFFVKGNRPYKDWTPLPFVPLPTEDCLGCGECAEVCPVHAIDENDPFVVDKSRCIACYACSVACPLQLRFITEAPFREKISGMAAKLSSRRCEPEWFL